MAISTHRSLLFTPTDTDVEQYRRTRVASRDLHEKIVKTVPRAALEEMGDLLGMRRDGGSLVFPFEDAVDAFMDACLYGWFREGRNLVEEFARTQAATGEPHLRDLETLVLNSATRARHCAFRIDEVVSQAGVRATDGRTGESFFLMDLALSGCPEAVGVWFTSRIVSYGEWNMTTGAALCLGPIPDPVMREELCQVYAPEPEDTPDETMDRAAVALTIVGLQLRAEAEPEFELSTGPMHSSAELPSSRPGRNEPCPCGSGKKYKHCCWS